MKRYNEDQQRIQSQFEEIRRENTQNSATCEPHVNRLNEEVLIVAVEARGTPIVAANWISLIGSVEEYQRQFKKLVARTCHLRPEQEVEIFISGLQDYIVVEVELQQPTDLTSAMYFARLYERRKSENQLAQEVQRVDPSQTNTPSSTQRPSQYVKRLSRAEIAERRAKNLCFNCDGMAESSDDQEPHISPFLFTSCYLMISKNGRIFIMPTRLFN
ncbi:hypothetical protein Tco_0032107 [Tanacetum coccineum]